MFRIGSSSIKLGFDCEFDGINRAHTSGEKGVLKKEKSKLSLISDLFGSSTSSRNCRFGGFIKQINHSQFEVQVRIFMEEFKPELIE